MSKVIHKFYASGTGEDTFQVPAGAKLLSVQNQRGEVVYWFEIESPVPEAKEERKFFYALTGISFESDEARYVATVQSTAGDLVIHIYEKIEGYPS